MIYSQIGSSYYLFFTTCSLAICKCYLFDRILREVVLPV